MDSNTAKRISENPKYRELVSKRSSFAWKLSIVMLVIYYAFILMIAFDPSALGASLGGVMTVGIPVGIFIIVAAFVLTGIYVNRANGEFDDLSQAIKNEMRDVQ